jgi:hypothetical protein
VPQQASPAAQQSATPIMPAVQLHQGNMRPSPNVGVPTSRTGCAPQQSVSAVIGGHTISLSANSSTASSIIHQNHHQVQALEKFKWIVVILTVLGVVILWNVALYSWSCKNVWYAIHEGLNSWSTKTC